MNQYIFSTKEMFLLERNSRGDLYQQKNMSRNYRKMYELNNMHLLENVPLSAINQFPSLKAYTGRYDWDDDAFVRFSHRRSSRKTGCVVHCFEYDYNFERFWTHMGNVIYELKDFEAVFTPDFTMFVDAPEPHNKWQLFKSRLCGARMQIAGYNVIPTITYADASSLNWCLEGLAPNGVYGISATGLKDCSAKLRLFLYAIRKIEEVLSPVMVFAYGEPIEDSSITTPIRFIPTQISKYFRNEHKI
ncbi:MAG: DUF4417 domain-containing protein [Alloprevotella sp.]